mmetsp:Transcript_3583/g.9583  ORF Transcript_3583/g.9583 Transcript_3583/m.9583 type:complete len:644 (+) Transcript_3583:1833-3764(+)|eukprot:CAMPEP_0113535630 /NCGR_PEP_ID=MMETSP0015_2-20120614/5817_1 /TAXON_ID=2838 /ORGANISM="Odontella" /LENGTH=643 /DNA_ID=CAMNT_0000434915 /DNA_START=1708 /DNA_END=3639 /DNA_ORIENTATION=- /assembly_acc=CAM_ASM_000160
MSILPHDLRLSTLAQATDFFDHRDRTAHGAELREGAAPILYQKLAFALHQSSRAAGTGSLYVGGYGAPAAGAPPRIRPAADTSDADHEISMIASCLEMVHRASTDCVAVTWDEIGHEVMPLLVRVIERPFDKMARAMERAVRDSTPGGAERAVATAINRDMKLAVQKVTKLLAIYSLVPEAKVAMCNCQGMLPALVKIIDTQNFNRMRPSSKRLGSVNDTHRRGSGGSVAGGSVYSTGSSRSHDMSSRSLGQSSRTLGGSSRNLGAGGSGVRGTSSGVGLHMTEAARFNVIATLTNLAAAEPNRMRMLAEPGLVDNVARVVHNERSDVARQCSALAIMNLSNGDREHVPELAGNDLLLETLIKLMGDDSPETRRNAAVALFNVACADQNTVKLARYKDGVILEALMQIVATDDEEANNMGSPVGAGNDEARTNAAETLFNMSCSETEETTDRMANHCGLLEALATTLRSHHAHLDVKMYCAATLRRMAEITHAPKASQGALLSALVKASVWTRTSCIAEAYRAQAAEEGNRANMAKHHGLLNALSKLALTGEMGDHSAGMESDKVRAAAVSALEMIAREEEARPLMAHNEGVMMVLTRASYGSSGAGVVPRPEYEEGEEEKDGDPYEESHLIQVALKNLVEAM